MAKVVKSTRDVVDVNEEIQKLEGKKKTEKAKVESKSKKVSDTTKATKKETNNKDTSKKLTTAKTDKKKKKSKDRKKNSSGGFFREVRKEVSKVKWPSKKDMVKYSVATLVFILFFAGFFYIIELILALLKMGV